MAASPIVDLPAPDSPISPSTLPLPRVKETPSTMMTSRDGSPGGWIVASIFRSRTTRRGSDIAAPSFQAGGAVERPIDDEVHAYGQRGDGEARDKRRRDAEDNAVLVLLHHGTPVGDRRLHAQPEEGERGEEENGEGEAQAELGDERRQRVRQDFAEHDPAPALAAQPRRLDKIHYGDVDRHGPADAEDAGGIEHRHDEDEDIKVGRQHGEDDEREDQRR